MTNSTVELFCSRLPGWLVCANDLRDDNKPYHAPKNEALQHRLIGISKTCEHQAIVIDLDYATHPYEYQDRNLPAPSLFIGNPDNGHAHLIYLLKTPVFTGGAAREHPQRYFRAVKKALTSAFDGDLGYNNLICKNPLHKHWRTVELNTNPWDLGELCEWLEINPKKNFRCSGESESQGRNSDLFDKLRNQAYNLIDSHRDCFDKWTSRLESIAQGINDEYDIPMSFNEVLGIVKSVSKWVWNEYIGSGGYNVDSELQSR